MGVAEAVGPYPVSMGLDLGFGGESAPRVVQVEVVFGVEVPVFGGAQVVEYRRVGVLGVGVEERALLGDGGLRVGCVPVAFGAARSFVRFMLPSASCLSL